MARKKQLEDGYKVSLNTVAHYRQELGLKAVLTVKQVNATILIKTHKKYSYKLQGLGINSDYTRMRPKATGGLE